MNKQLVCGGVEEDIFFVRWRRAWRQRAWGPQSIIGGGDGNGGVVTLTHGLTGVATS